MAAPPDASHLADALDQVADIRLILRHRTWVTERCDVVDAARAILAEPLGRLVPRVSVELGEVTNELPHLGKHVGVEPGTAILVMPTLVVIVTDGPEHLLVKRRRHRERRPVPRLVDAQ